MARSLSAASVSSLLAQQTGEAYLLLLTISDDTGVIHRMTSDAVDTNITASELVPSPTFTEWADPTVPDGWGDYVSPDAASPSSWHVEESTSPQGMRVVSNGTNTGVKHTSLITAGNKYAYSLTVDVTDGEVAIVDGTGPGIIVTTSGTGTYAGYFTAAESEFTIKRAASTGTVDTVVTNMSIKSTTTYEPYSFDLHLPKNVEGQVSSATLTIDNVSRTLIESIRTKTSPLQVDMKVVLGSDPTDTLVEFTDYVLQGVTYDALSISGTLSLENFLSEPVGKLMTGSNYPGLFYT